MPINMRYASIADLADDIPLFPLEGALLLPDAALPLNVFEPRYLQMVDAALAGARLIGMIQPRGPEVGGTLPLYDVGCVGRITHLSETGDGRYQIVLTGVARFRILQETTAATAFRTASVDYGAFAHDLDDGADDSRVDRSSLLATLRSYSQKNGFAIDWDNVNKAPSRALVDALSVASPFGAREKQALLEAADVAERAGLLIAIAEMDMAGDDASQRPVQ